jgi:hypothetical protein
MFDAELKCLKWECENTWSAILDFLPPNSPTKQTHNNNSPLPSYSAEQVVPPFVGTFFQCSFSHACNQKKNFFLPDYCDRLTPSQITIFLSLSNSFILTLVSSFIKGNHLYIVLETFSCRFLSISNPNVVFGLIPLNLN